MLPHRSTSLGLYRDWVKLGHNWPFEHQREGFTIREHILGRVKTEFRQNKDVSDPEKLNSLLLNGRKDFVFMNNLRENKWQQMYPTPRSSLNEMAALEAKMVITAKAMTPKKEGLFTRLLKKLVPPKDDEDEVPEKK